MKRILTLCLASIMTGTLTFAQEDITASAESTDLVAVEMPDDVAALSAYEGPTISQSFSLRQDDFRGADKQDQVYILKPKIDVPITVVGAAWSLYAFSKIYSKEDMPVEKIMNLNKEDINGFDRWGAGKTNEQASTTSDYLFYGSMPLPVVLMLDKKIRKDALKIGFLYLESMAITGLLYTGSVYFTDRIRPETYNTSLPMDERRNGNNQNSFFAGHPALVATSTFFCAKVYSDYHPESSWRWVFFGGAAAATGATAYLRHVAGKHFPSDLIVGTAVGTLSGILVPHLHKNKNHNAQAWNIGPALNYRGEGMGLSFTYKF